MLDTELGEGEQEQVRFFHHQLQEFLAARALLARYRSGQEMQPYWRQPLLKQEMPAPGPLKAFEPLPLPPQTGWEEPTILAAGLAGEPGSRVQTGEFLESLRGINPVLAARCLVEPGLTDLSELLDATRRALLGQMSDGRNHRRARLAAGLALGSLGDTRFSVFDIDGVPVKLPPLVHMPGGRYRVGSSAWQVFWMKRRGWQVENETPRHTVALAPYWIGQYPVTNGEYRCFMDDGGYEGQRYWQTEAAWAWRSGQEQAEGPIQEWMGVWQSGHDHPEQALESLRSSGLTTERISFFETIFNLDEDQARELFQKNYGDRDRNRPAFWEDGRYNNTSQPVVGITWYEAQAYCSWLEEKLQQLSDHPDLFAGWTGASLFSTVQPNERLIVRLPSEPEWEAAARGGSGRAYPWGERFDEDCANTVEGGLNRSSPVGIYPAGGSRNGLQDLSGNVWEWTLSLYQEYPCRPGDGRDELQTSGHRVVRGGSWNYIRRAARCAYRGWFIPSNFYGDLGFRVVLSLAPPES